MSIYDIRRENLRLICARHGGKQAVALKLGHSNGSYLSQLIGPNPSKQISEPVAREYEQTLGLQPGCVDLPNLGEGLHAGERAAQYAVPAKLDDKLLLDATRAVLEAARDALRPIPADKLADAISFLYHGAVATGAVDIEQARRLIAMLGR